MKSPVQFTVLAAATLLMPCAIAEEFVLQSESLNCDYLVPSVANGGSALGLTWTAIAEPANYANWTKGVPLGVGYDSDPTYGPFIGSGSNVDGLMRSVNATAYVRIPFEISDPGLIDSLTTLILGVRADDGFIAYLNGVRVADRNPPAVPSWNSNAGGTTGDATAQQLTPFNITGAISLLRPGTNVIALHGLNVSSTSSDFLISSQLVGSDEVTPAPRVVEIASGFVRPVEVKHSGDGTGRLFVVEKPGRVRIVTGEGVLLPTPFLSITTPVDDAGNEEGLLGIAFPPDFATKQYFYVYYTSTSNDSRVVRYSVTANNPNLADPNSGEVIISVAQPFSNHNGGQIQFGPNDGYLYIGFGDGGSGNDPSDRSQNKQNLLGKMLRIDVEGTPDAGLAYAIPPSNPFVGDSTTRDEVWSLGLRNPWRFSFDRLNGDLFIGDVGQNAIEEINYEPAGEGGRNYGWRYYEGTRTNVTTGVVPSSPVFPAFEYAQSVGGFSVIGGYVYRGSRFPRMYGKYFYSDYTGAELRSLERNASGVWETETFMAFGFNPTGFGEDEEGTLYVVSESGGVGGNKLYRIEDTQDSNYLNNLSLGTTQDGRPTVTVGVAIGRSYQLQISDDLEEWEDVGSAVTANEFSLSFELPVANFAPPRQFMRVAELN